MSGTKKNINVLDKSSLLKTTKINNNYSGFFLDVFKLCQEKLKKYKFNIEFTSKNLNVSSKFNLILSDKIATQKIR